MSNRISGWEPAPMSGQVGERISLNGLDWQFKGYIGEDWAARGAHQPNSRDWRNWRAGRVPGSVQDDLMCCGELPNPYFERNSLLVEWVPERTWVYKKNFTIGSEYKGKRIRLQFSGVDYAAQFYLNGEWLGDHQGMFTPARFEIGERMKFGEGNLLAVVIDPAPQEQPQVGRTSRVRTHKSRMNYWWDFCPRMVHLGIWDDVFLEVTGPIRIENVFVRPRLSADLSRADISVLVRLAGLLQNTVEIQTVLYDEGKMIASQSVTCPLVGEDTQQELRFEIEEPQVWWPNGHGEQPLYEAEVRVIANGRKAGDQASDCRRVSFGLRSIEFLSNDGAGPGARPYTLQVNGEKIYIKGWNWVPIDVLYGVERTEKLERLLQLAKRAHVNMLRVWGGGLIEKEGFFDLCDRLGILVWQEFIQSSSGIENDPPSDPDFIKLMVAEAEEIIPRKRNHPSLAIWCGGNELQSGPDRPVGDEHPLLGALRETVQKLDPDRHWLPTSPSGPVFAYSLENIARDPASLHDVHGPWEHQGLNQHPALYNRGSSLLHSEFGVEGITNLRALNATISKDNQWPVSLDNPVWEHLGAWWVKESCWREIFGDLPDVETTVGAVQFLQADGLRYAVEADRRRKYHNSGTFPWQFNEPYPMAACTSAVDYFGEPKPAYYAVAGTYAPLLLSAKFPRQAWAGENHFECEIWVSNSSTQETAEALLEARLIGASGKCYDIHSRATFFLGNCSAPLASVRWPLVGIEEQIFFLDLALREPGGSLVACNRYVFSRTEDLAAMLRMPKTELKVRRTGERQHWEVEVVNTGTHTALFVQLQTAGEQGGEVFAYFSRNHFCLFPQEIQTVAVDWGTAPGRDRRLAAGGWNTGRLTVV